MSQADSNKILKKQDLANNDHSGTARAYEILSSIVPKIYINADISGDFKNLLKIFAEQYASLKAHTEGLPGIVDPENIQTKWIEYFCANFGFEFSREDVPTGRWKDFLRNLPRWLHAKGTKDSIEILCRNFGFTPILEMFGDYMPHIGDVYDGPYAQQKSSLIYDNISFRAEDYGSYNNAVMDENDLLESGIGLEFSGNAATAPEIYTGNKIGSGAASSSSVMYADNWSHSLKQNAISGEFHTQTTGTGNDLVTFKFDDGDDFDDYQDGDTHPHDPFDQPWRSLDYGAVYSEDLPADFIDIVESEDVGDNKTNIKANKSIIFVDVMNWVEASDEDGNPITQLKPKQVIRLKAEDGIHYEHCKIEQVQFYNSGDDSDAVISPWKPITSVGDDSPLPAILYHKVPGTFSAVDDTDEDGTVIQSSGFRMAVIKLIRNVAGSELLTIPAERTIDLSDTVGQVIDAWNIAGHASGRKPSLVIPYEVHQLFSPNGSAYVRQDIYIECTQADSIWNDIMFETFLHHWSNGESVIRATSIQNLIEEWNDYVQWMGADAPTIEITDARMAVYNAAFQSALVDGEVPDAGTDESDVHWYSRPINVDRLGQMIFHSGREMIVPYHSSLSDYAPPGEMPPDSGEEYGVKDWNFTKKELISYEIRKTNEVPIGVEINSTSFLNHYVETSGVDGFEIGGSEDSPETQGYDTSSPYVSGTGGHTIETKWPNKTTSRKRSNGDEICGTCDGHSTQNVHQPHIGNDDYDGRMVQRAIGIYDSCLTESFYEGVIKSPDHTYSNDTDSLTWVDSYASASDFSDISDGYNAAAGDSKEDDPADTNEGPVNVKGVVELQGTDAGTDSHYALHDGFMNVPGVSSAERIGFPDKLWKSWEGSFAQCPVDDSSISINIDTLIGYRGIAPGASGDVNIRVLDDRQAGKYGPINCWDFTEEEHKGISYTEMGIVAPNGVIYEFMESGFRLCEIGQGETSQSLQDMVRGAQSAGEIMTGWPWSYCNPTNKTIRLKDPVTGEYLSETSKHFNIPPGRIVLTFRNNFFECVYDYYDDTVDLEETFNPYLESGLHRELDCGALPATWEENSSGNSVVAGDLVLIGNGLHMIHEDAATEATVIRIIKYDGYDNNSPRGAALISKGYKNIITTGSHGSGGDPSYIGTGGQIQIRKVKPNGILAGDLSSATTGRTFLLGENPRGNGAGLGAASDDIGLDSDNATFTGIVDSADDDWQYTSFIDADDGWVLSNLGEGSAIFHNIADYGDGELGIYIDVSEQDDGFSTDGNAKRFKAGARYCFEITVGNVGGNFSIPKFKIMGLDGSVPNSYSNGTTIVAMANYNTGEADTSKVHRVYCDWPEDLSDVDERSGFAIVADNEAYEDGSKWLLEGIQVYKTETWASAGMPSIGGSVSTNKERVTVSYNAMAKNFANMSEAANPAPDIFPVCHDFNNDYDYVAAIFDRLPVIGDLALNYADLDNFYTLAASFNAEQESLCGGEITHYINKWNKWDDGDHSSFRIGFNPSVKRHAPGSYAILWRLDSEGTWKELFIGARESYMRPRNDNVDRAEDDDHQTAKEITNYVWLDYEMYDNNNFLNSGIMYSYYDGEAANSTYVNFHWTNGEDVQQGKKRNWTEGHSKFTSPHSNSANYQMLLWQSEAASSSRKRALFLLNPETGSDASGSGEEWLYKADRFAITYHHEVYRPSTELLSSSNALSSVVVEGETYDVSIDPYDNPKNMIQTGRTDNRVYPFPKPYIDAVYIADNGDIAVRDAIPPTTQPLTGGVARFTGGTDDLIEGLTIGMEPERKIGTMMLLKSNDPAIVRRGLGSTFRIGVPVEQNPGETILNVAKKYIDRIVPVDTKFEGFELKNYSGVAFGLITPANAHSFGNDANVEYRVVINNFIVQHPDTPGGQGYMCIKYKETAAPEEDYVKLNIYDIDYDVVDGKLTNDGTATISLGSQTFGDYTVSTEFTVIFELVNNNGDSLGNGVTVTRTFTIT